MDAVLCDLHGISVSTCSGVFECLCAAVDYTGLLWLTGVKNSQRGTVLIGKYQFTSSEMVAKGIWQKKMVST